MARKETVTSITTVTEPGQLVLTEEQRKCEELVIRANINQRPNSIGNLDIEKLIPRVWVGYIWLVHKNSIVKVETVDFENKTIYRETLLWKAEIPIQLAVQLINIPNAEPGTVAEQTAVFNLLTSQENNGAYYFPFPQQIDTIYYWFPPGCVLDLVIDYRPWSDILNPDGSIAIPTLPNVEEDDLVDLPALGTLQPAETLAEVCEAQYPNNWLNEAGTTYRIYFESSDGTNNYQRTVKVASRTPVGIVTSVTSGQGAHPPLVFYPATATPSSCAELPIAQRTSRTGGSNETWARVLIETEEGQAYLLQTGGQQFGQATINFDSIQITKC